MSTSLLVIAGLLSMMDPDGVVTTAPGGGHQAIPLGVTAPTAAEVPPVSSQTITPHGLTTDQQIDHWLAARTAEDRPFAEDRAPWPMGDDRKVHGEVSAAIGTGDFTAYSATVSLPVGENGRVDLSYSESKNAPWAYAPYSSYDAGYGYGYGSRVGRYRDRYSSGSSQSVGIRFESGSSRNRVEEVGRARTDPWRDRPRDPTAPLGVIED